MRDLAKSSALIGGVAVFVCVVILALWLATAPPRGESLRVPVPRPASAPGSRAVAVNAGTLIPGPGKPAPLTGAWPQFRGARRDGIADVSDPPLARSWPGGGPPILWRVPVGEGYAGAAIDSGRVYLVDYDRERQEDAIRCLSLDDGAEIWRYTYANDLKRNHGMSRTVPAVSNGYVVALGPKCHVHCLKADTGERVWSMDLVADFGAIVPPWYAGQCPLIDGDRVILAPAARPLMLAVDLAAGKIVWRTQGHEDMGMTHSSIMPFEFEGRRQYAYCTGRGVVGIAADDGAVLWEEPEWKIGIANIPSPVSMGEGRLFVTGGYNAGSAMLTLAKLNGGLDATLARLGPDGFSADQQTPILYRDHFYANAAGGELACMDREGKRVWGAGPGTKFGLGPLLIADGLLFALEGEGGTLHLAEASPDGYRELAKAKVLDGPDAWGPMALADGRLALRDLNQLVCLNVGQ